MSDMSNSSSAFPHLFTPIKVGPHELASRALMGSMHTNLEESGEGLTRLAAFYAERARGGCALMVTGGFAPNREGRMNPPAAYIESEADIADHAQIPAAVQREGGRILLQLLHAGRYGYHDEIVAPSAIKSPINKDIPRELSDEEIAATIADFARAAKLAQQAGYDGVELMGSEGYLVNEFTAPHTNKREDRWGGSFENRARFPIEMIKAVRAATDPSFIIMYRLSVLDIVEDGSPFEEVVALAKMAEEAGVDILNSGVGWHEARIPTIAQAVPRGGWTWATARLMGKVSVPLVGSNRINTPEVAERIIAGGEADMVSMARPFLADADFMAKARDGHADDINTCIACNQACLDHYFTGQPATCLVNPRAARETELNWGPASAKKKVAVVGAGVAGLACATIAAERGHDVTLFEAHDAIGGQFALARAIPGKEEFDETLRYYRGRIAATGVDLKLGTEATAADLKDFDETIIACGVAPRVPEIEGIDHPKVMTYEELLSGAREPGRRVAVIGAGGIGVDVSVHLVERGHKSHQDVAAFRKTWGVDGEADPPAPAHEVVLLQRSDGRMGAGPGKSTGWVHRLVLLRSHVEMIGGANYRRIDDEGLHITVGGEGRVIPCDSVILCAGQDSRKGLAGELEAAGASVHVIGGAKLARELDAQRAIEEGVRLAAAL
jgi:2,4-dienoyl-CoA reductase (NADPH2)